MTEDDLISTREAAKISGFHIEHIRRLLRGGDLQGRRFGSIWMVSKQSLLTYLDDEEKRKPGPPKKS